MPIDKDHKNIWDWEYRPITLHSTAQGDLVTDSKKADHTWHEVWDFAYVTWATFNTYALAKEHAKHLSNQVGFEHVLLWKHYLLEKLCIEHERIRKEAS